MSRIRATIVLVLSQYLAIDACLAGDLIERLVSERSLGRIGPTAIADQLRVSPDGRRIAFVIGADGKTVDPSGDLKDGASKVIAVVDGKEGSRYDVISYGGQFGSVLFSPDSQRVAYVGSVNGQLHPVVDGKVRDHYLLNPHIVFSPDSQRIAYVTSVDGQQCATVDEKSEGCFKSIYDWPVFSADSKRVAFLASDGQVDLRFVVVDKKPSKWIVAGNTPPIFSPDSKHIAFVATKSAQSVRKSFVVLDDREGKHYIGIGNSVVFSPDSKRLAYSAVVRVGDKNKEIVVVDGKEGSIHDGVVGALKFSPDSTRVAYVAREQTNERFVVVDNKEGEHYGGIGVPVFSADSKRLAYSAANPQSGEYGLVVVEANGKTSKIHGGYNPMFSPDGRQLAYVVKLGEKFSVVLDGKQGAYYEDISDGLTFSPDSKHLAYAAQRGGKWTVVIDGQEGKSYEKVVVKALGSSGSLWASDSPGSLHFDTPRSLHYLAVVNRRSVLLVEEHLR